MFRFFEKMTDVESNQATKRVRSSSFSFLRQSPTVIINKQIESHHLLLIICTLDKQLSWTQLGFKWTTSSVVIAGLCPHVSSAEILDGEEEEEEGRAG